MRLTAEEKLMYEVMKAVYDSGIPVDFKGSMVLKACLLEAGYSEEIRHTVDIDANWYSEVLPTAEGMTESLQKALDKNGIDLTAHLYRMYGEGRSAGFELKDTSTGEILFSMDIDVNRPAPPTQIYEIAEFRFRGVSPAQMLADKVYVLSSDKIFRKIKDVVDLYYLSKAFPFDKAVVLQTLTNDGKTLDTFYGFFHRKDALQHAYEKFRFTGGADKPPFSEIYSVVKAYIKDILPEAEKYAKRLGIKSGLTSCTRSGGTFRHPVWAERKSLCGDVSVKGSKIFQFRIPRFAVLLRFPFACGILSKTTKREGILGRWNGEAILY